MSGVETTLKRQLGVTPQVDMDEAVIWFKWDKPEALEPWRVNAAVVDGGMGITQFRILGAFDFANGKAKAGPLELAFQGEAPANGKYALEIYGYESKQGGAKVHAIRTYVEPKIYNANR